ncbi:hypothetical protein KC325_g76 [Hortaea werneckii]|nr:hypothetical protein KC325_g76 [Hortaea werneckii]
MDPEALSQVGPSECIFRASFVTARAPVGTHRRRASLLCSCRHNASRTPSPVDKILVFAKWSSSDQPDHQIIRDRGNRAAWKLSHQRGSVHEVQRQCGQPCLPS